jgi:large subunit ribosomal protein L27
MMSASEGRRCYKDGRLSLDGNIVTGGSILVRQRGRKFRPGLNVGLGKADTLFAKVPGRVKFEDHGSRGRFISVHPVTE